MAKKKVVRWYQAGASLGWSKSDTQSKRRRAALASRKGNLLSAARALQALANVTRDSQTRQRAHADAQYFYALYKKKSKKK